VDRVKKFSFFVMTAASAVVIVLIMTAALVLNSGMVDEFARKQLLALINEEYRGRLELKEVRVRFPDQVTLVTPGIFEEGVAEPVACAKNITLKFNFLSLLRPKITMLSFSEVEIDEFKGSIVEYPDGKLNINNIFNRRHPEKPEVLAIGKFRAGRLSIRNGALSWKPKNGQAYRLNNLRLDLSKAFVAKYQFMGTIKSMQFAMPEQGLTLRKGSGSLAFSSVRSDIIDLDIQTGKSSAQLSLSMDGLDIFSGISKKSILHNQTFAHIEAISLDTSELNRFIKIPALPEGVYKVTGDAKGTLSDLEIMPSSIEHDGSRIAFKGQMLDLLNWKNLSFRLQIDKSNLSPGVLTQALKEERYRKLASETGGVAFSGMLRGRLDQWETDIDFRTAIGSGKSAVEIKRSGNGRYQASGNFSLEKAELHRLLAIGQAKSSFTGAGTFSAAFSASDIETAHVETSIKSAFWQQQAISSGSISLDLKGKRVDLSTDLKTPDGGSLVMAGLIDYSGVTPSYELGGTVRKLDISKATGVPDYKSDLNGKFELKGSGIDPASLNLKTSMVLGPSSFSDFSFRDQSALSANIVQSAGASTVSIENDAFDLSLQGNTSIARMLEAFRTISACVSKEFGQHGAVPVPQGASPYTFNYRIAIRDITPLRPFLPAKEFLFRGVASGKVTCHENSLSLDADISSTALSNGPSLFMENTTLKASGQCAAGGISTARISGTAGSTKFFGRELKNLRLLASFENDHLTVSFELAMPRFDEKLAATFEAQRTGNLATLSIDKLQLTTPRGLWLSAPGGTIDITREYLRFNRVRFAKGAESLLLDGMLSSTIPGTFQGTLSNLDLSEGKFFILDPGLKPMSGLVNARFTVSGNPGAKTSDLDVKGSGVTYDEMRIGSLHLTARHTDDLLHFDYESHGTASQAGIATVAPVNTIKGSGSIPLLIDYSAAHFRIPENRPVQVAFHSDDLSARIVTFLVPIIDYADGAIPTDLRVSGAMPKPDIHLTARLNDTKIRVAPTQVTYLLTGQITGNPSRIDIDHLSIRDTREGTGTISGLVGLDGLKPVSVNLSGSFRNTLLYDKKDMKDDTAFGTITGTTDNLRFYGELTAPTAEGDLRLTSANFSLYRKGSNESAKYIGVEKFITFVPRHPGPKPIEAATAKAPEYPQFHYNLLDILQIKNFRIWSNAPVKGTIIFDRIRGERIEAAMHNLALQVNKSGPRYSLFGSVDMTGGKYTFSNTSFDLENSGKVTWNNDEIRDGNLIDIYGTKQITASDIQTGERDNVRLLIAVRGTIEKPDVRMGYYLNDDPQPYAATNVIGKQASHIDPYADLNVISMLFSRQWYLDPERHATKGLNTVSSVGFSAGTGLLSSQVSNIVQNIAGLESFNVNLGSNANGNLSGLELTYAILVPGTNGKMRFVGTRKTPVTESSNTTNYYYGSSQKIEYRVTPKVYVEASRSYGITSNNGTFTNLQKPTENWGASVSYREKFHTWSQFWDHLFGGKKKETKKEKQE
jgi:hypothetical protein